MGIPSWRGNIPGLMLELHPGIQELWPCFHPAQSPGDSWRQGMFNLESHCSAGGGIPEEGDKGSRGGGCGDPVLSVGRGQPGRVRRSRDPFPRDRAGGRLRRGQRGEVQLRARLQPAGLLREDLPLQRLLERDTARVRRYGLCHGVPRAAPGLPGVSWCPQSVLVSPELPQCPQSCSGVPRGVLVSQSCP